ncbi:MAG: hypothetical protein KGJ09_01395 [Candidatus Omnitrophica bacterium]|nr:hypothetical protein [Candidatus Omnitrophota bacterium]MDE2008715.1 hypothetical protein [Candidatus Omnitrophota bacterium]MDE2214856.1 hypothetical protein [Candidatus Omnitrophota bacterium]MDE2231976.1 hypothetical protein [Candidatus Omnitrophota bacterium]
MNVLIVICILILGIFLGGCSKPGSPSAGEDDFKNYASANVQQPETNPSKPIVNVAF